MSETIVSPNERVPGSLITDSTILQPGDFLHLQGSIVSADVAVLDQHDLATPEAEAMAIAQTEAIFGYVPNPQTNLTVIALRGLFRAALVSQGVLPAHHHVLIRLADSNEVVSTGMLVGQGQPSELLFGHVTSRYQAHDWEFRLRQRAIHELLLSDPNLGMYYVSDHEDISQMPEAAEFLGPDGGLKV